MIPPLGPSRPVARERGRRPARAAALGLLAGLLGGCAPHPAASSGALGISVPYEVDTLDPHAHNTLSNFSMASNFYESLVTTDADMRIRPALARLWENPDPSTWTFHLQQGVTFHSGKPFGADDVVYTMRRLMTSPDLEMTSYVLYITDVTAIDPLTVRIRSTAPVSTFLNKLRFVSVVPKGARDEDLAVRPDGTGPYILAEWSKGRSIRMRRNERYREPAGLPAEVVFLLDRAPEQAVKDPMESRSKLVQCRSRKAEAALQEAGRFRVVRRPGIFTKYMAFDMGRDVTPFVAGRPNPFKNPLVRRAMNIAIDRKRLVEGLSQAAVPANQPVPPSIFGFNPDLPVPAHDLSAARGLLEKAGLKDGFAVTLHVRKLFAEAAFLVQGQLREVGIQVTVKPLPDEEFLASLSRREYSLFLSRFGCPTGDASEILDTALHSFDPAKKMGLSNDQGYANPEVDRAIEASARIDGLQARGEALREVMAKLMEDVAWIPLYVDEDVYAMDRTLAWEPRNDSFILAAEATVR